MHYLDYNATTPVDPRVSDETISCLKENFENASSPNQYGLASKKIIENSKSIVSNILNCEENEIIFTS